MKVHSSTDNVKLEQEPNNTTKVEDYSVCPNIAKPNVVCSAFQGDVVSEVYNMDCVQGLKHYPDKYFDLAICDPPYGMLGNTFTSTSGTKTSNRLDRGGQKGLSIGERPTMEYFTELYRCSKNQIVFGMQYFVEYLVPHQCVLIWDKLNGTNRFSDAELAWTSFDTAVRCYSRYNKPTGRIHITQKPVELYDWILSNYAKSGQRILDTHLGSGSSRIAAFKHKMEFVGFEINNEYFEKQEKRYKDFVSQTRLF